MVLANVMLSHNGLSESVSLTIASILFYVNISIKTIQE